MEEADTCLLKGEITPHVKTELWHRHSLEDKTDYKCKMGELM